MFRGLHFVYQSLSYPKRRISNLPLPQTIPHPALYVYFTLRLMVRCREFWEHKICAERQASSCQGNSSRMQIASKACTIPELAASNAGDVTQYYWNYQKKVPANFSCWQTKVTTRTSQSDQERRTGGSVRCHVVEECQQPALRLMDRAVSGSWNHTQLLGSSPFLFSVVLIPSLYVGFKEGG